MNINKIKSLITKLKRKLGALKRKRPEFNGNNLARIQEPLNNLGSRVSLPKIGIRKPLILIGILVIAFFVVRIFISESPAEEAETQVSGKIPVAKPKMSTEINREFTFAFPGAKSNQNEEDEDENEVEPEQLNFIYKLQKAEITDEIVVQGKKVNTVEGRTFLIFTLALTNNNTSSLEIKTRNFIRLQVGDSEEKFAPDIHNDPVTVQATSTKYTRLGFPINEGEKDFTLYVGKIGGEKEPVKVSFR